MGSVPAQLLLESVATRLVADSPIHLPTVNEVLLFLDERTQPVIHFGEPLKKMARMIKEAAIDVLTPSISNGPIRLQNLVQK